MADTSFLTKLRQLPVISAALAEDAAALVRRREALLDRRAQAEVDGARAHEALKAAVVSASRRRLKAWEAYIQAEAAEAAASAAADGHHHQNETTIAGLNAELRASAANVVTAAAETARLLRIEHSRLRTEPLPSVTQVVSRETRDGGARMETVVVADFAGRAAELKALRDASEAIQQLVLEMADPAAILDAITACRARFGLPAIDSQDDAA